MPKTPTLYLERANVEHAAVLGQFDRLFGGRKLKGRDYRDMLLSPTIEIYFLRDSKYAIHGVAVVLCDKLPSKAVIRRFCRLIDNSEGAVIPLLISRITSAKPTAFSIVVSEDLDWLVKVLTANNFRATRLFKDEFTEDGRQVDGIHFLRLPPRTRRKSSPAESKG